MRDLDLTSGGAFDAKSMSKASSTMDRATVRMPVNADEINSRDAMSDLKDQYKLNLSGLSAMGLRITSTEKGYKIHCNNHHMTSSVFSLISKANPGIEVQYSRDLDARASKLINKTENPLWSFTQEGDDFVLERQF